ncbi:hypothetical protein Bca52824_093555 [Brassica carinata]|uniref:Pentatricopeptide repeat-containing protein n=1 Tax=Brassica carinata TaxID=52824 RepID=A0A8X7P5Z8_BRACI|nr:hypothetical protein Bca52824_093555 [Brassica carinata]
MSIRDTLEKGRNFNAQIIRNSNEKNVYIGSTLVCLYCNAENLVDGFNVLQQLPSTDVVAWTAVISGCSSSGHESEPLDFLKEMIQDGVEPKPFTYSQKLLLSGDRSIPFQRRIMLCQMSLWEVL